MAEDTPGGDDAKAGKEGERMTEAKNRAARRAAAKRKATGDRPVVDRITVSFPGLPAQQDPAPPLSRPGMASGTPADYLEEEELRDVLHGMADRFSRLERLYRARQAEGLSEDNDADTRRIRTSLENLEIVCFLLTRFVQTDAHVADAALRPFYEAAAEADRVLQAHSANATGPLETVH